MLLWGRSPKVLTLVPAPARLHAPSPARGLSSWRPNTKTHPCHTSCKEGQGTLSHIQFWGFREIFPLGVYTWARRLKELASRYRMSIKLICLGKHLAGSFSFSLSAFLLSLDRRQEYLSPVLHFILMHCHRPGRPLGSQRKKQFKQFNICLLFCFKTILEIYFHLITQRIASFYFGWHISEGWHWSWESEQR